MAVSREKKGAMLVALKDIFKNPSSLVFLNFHGLTVTDANTLRKKLRDAGVRYLVSKKTLVRKAMEDAPIEGMPPDFEGELAIAYGEDQLVPLREIHGFEKKLHGALKILGGIFEKRFIGRDAAIAIATIPPREVLLAQFAQLMHSPLTRLAMALDQVAKKK